MEHGQGETDAERVSEWSGHAPSLENLRGLRLSALLSDVMDELGLVKAAEMLGVDRKTLWRCRSTGRLTPRLAEALERLLLSRDLSSAMRQGERIDGLERRLEELAGALRGGLGDVEADVAALREEHAKSMRHVERRLVRLEEGRSAQDAPEAARNRPAPGPEGRRTAVPRAGDAGGRARRGAGVRGGDAGDRRLAGSAGGVSEGDEDGDDTGEYGGCWGWRSPSSRSTA